MTIRRLTPEETRAIFGHGLMIFDQQLIKAYQRQNEEKKRREQAQKQQKKTREGDHEQQP